MDCQFWKIVSWLFFSIVVLESLYAGFMLNCWLGLFACGVGFIGGLLYGKYRQNKRNDAQ